LPHAKQINIVLKTDLEDVANKHSVWSTIVEYYSWLVYKVNLQK